VKVVIASAPNVENEQHIKQVALVRKKGVRNAAPRCSGKALIIMSYSRESRPARVSRVEGLKLMKWRSVVECHGYPASG